MRRYFSGEHPVTAVVAVVAIVGVMLLILWARYAVLCAESHSSDGREIEAAATAARFATGLSP
ncbi:MAG TPA: hypothetical protein VF943_11265 [Burkholderiales bacterium]